VDSTATALFESLQAQRGHVTGTLDGLAADDLLRPVLPSGWSCLGLVQHLALDVERFWFRAVVAGELKIPGADETAGSAWEIQPETTVDDVFTLYRDEIDHANRIITSTPVDSAPLGWPADLFGDFRLPDLRAVMLHVITETACHAGHLDAARELLDGRLWMAL
jgi:hypothetical protein